MIDGKPTEISTSILLCRTILEVSLEQSEYKGDRK